MAEKSAEVLISEPDEPAIDGRADPTGKDIERKLAEVLAEVFTRRTGFNLRPLLHRSRRELLGHGPILRAGQKETRPAVGVDEGHLSAPHDPKPGGGCRHHPR